ncbi:MAG: hypothetical protein ACXIUM_06085 [Wenzhouxiangella sp.]
MSRRCLGALCLIALVLALGFAALQSMWLVSGLAPGLESQRPLQRSNAMGPGGAVAVLESEWRRVSWELGRRPPAVEDRKDN